MRKQKGFTLVELLVVIAIIGLLSTLAVVALNNARSKARDAKRVADVKQIQTALELFYNDCGSYPVLAAFGPLTAALQATVVACDAAGESTVGTFLSQIPDAPTPYDGTTCAVGNAEYDYQSTTSTGAACNGAAATACPSYALEYCLGSQTGSIVGNTALVACPSGMRCN